MTTPVGADDIVQGAVKFLQSKPDVQAVLGRFGSPPSLGLWQYRLWGQLEGSESTACVIESDGGWAGANLHNTLRFPRLRVDIWGDPIRDGGRNGVDPGEVQRRVNRAYEVIDRHLHRVAEGTQMWGSIRTVACFRLTEPVVYVVPDGDGLLRHQTYYAVTQG